MRVGVTLLECLIVVAILGLLTGLAVWPIARFDDRIRVEVAAGQLLGAYRQASAHARRMSRPTELVVAGDSLVIRTIWQGDTALVWQAPGPHQNGVALSPAAHSVGFDLAGLATGVANVTHVLTRGAVRRQVVVSRLGRVRVMP